jgi:hypothetical protein
MYQEIRTQDPEQIITAIRAVMESHDAVSITLNKRDDLYSATLVQAIEPVST